MRDNSNNNPLQNLNVTLNLKNDRGEKKVLSLSSDSEGKIYFTEVQTNTLDVQIITDEYAVHTERTRFSLGSNFRIVKLSKGGILEVNAATSDQQHIDTLMAKITTSYDLASSRPWSGKVQQEDLLMKYHQAKDTFSLRLPECPIKINFHSSTYIDITAYNFLI